MRRGLRLGCFYAKNPKAPYSTAKDRESIGWSANFPRHKWMPINNDEWESPEYRFNASRWKQEK